MQYVSCRVQYMSCRMQYSFWPFKISLGFDPDNHLDPQGGKQKVDGMQAKTMRIDKKQAAGRDCEDDEKQAIKLTMVDKYVIT